MFIFDWSLLLNKMKQIEFTKTVVPWISKFVLRQWYLDNVNFRIVDVRGADFKVGKLPKTINIPYEK
jgi:hypothetical protein